MINRLPFTAVKSASCTTLRTLSCSLFASAASDYIILLRRKFALLLLQVTYAKYRKKFKSIKASRNRMNTINETSRTDVHSSLIFFIKFLQYRRICLQLQSNVMHGQTDRQQDGQVCRNTSACIACCRAVNR